MSELAEQKCGPCSGDTPPLAGDAIDDQKRKLSSHWDVLDQQELVGQFRFKNYYQTQAFVNAVAYVAHRADHHPDITFGYNRCRVGLTTHAINGLSSNDFICAARIDRLVDDPD